MMGKIKGFFAAGVLLVLLMAIMPVQVADAAEGDVYTVTYNLTGVDASPQETEVIEGSGLDLVFTPDSGYKLPDEISVQMAGEEMSGYIYESGNLIINEVYGNLVITVNAVPDDDEDSDFSDSDSDVYSISYDLYEVTASKQDGNVRAGTNYSVKLKANSGFRLDPLNVAVRVNGDYVASGYSYNEGLLEIDNVNGDIVIEAIAVQKASAKRIVIIQITAITVVKTIIRIIKQQTKIALQVLHHLQAAVQNLHRLFLAVVKVQEIIALALTEHQRQVM